MSLVLAVFGALRAALKTRTDLTLRLENLALRQQLAVLRRRKSRRGRTGRPPVGSELVNLVRTMALANPLWGAPRIHGELLKLGMDVSQRTVARLMPRRPKLGSMPFWLHTRRNSSAAWSVLSHSKILFGPHEYSREELVAEMGAAFLCGHCGIDAATLTESTSYTAGWLKALQNDTRMVVLAAAQAQKAADLILGRAPAPAVEQAA